MITIPLPDGRWLALERAEFDAAVRRGAELGLAARTTDSEADAPAERLMTSKELAARLGCNDTTVEQMARDRRIPSVRVGKLLRFEPAKVLAALKQRGSGC